MNTRSLRDVPGIMRVVEPVARMRLSKVTTSVPVSVFTSIDLASTIVPHPLYSVILFFFIR